MRIQLRRSTLVLAGLGLVTLLSMLAITCFTSASRPAVEAADDCQFFPETNYKVCGRFLNYWLTHGGLAQQGLPLSDVFEEQQPPPPVGDGQIHRVQYFQRARFEEHTENQPPYDVQLGLLGAEQYKAKYLAQPFVQITDRITTGQIYNHNAQDGNYYLELNLLITNVTPKKVTISPASITVRSLQLYDYKVDDATYALTQCLKLTELLPGEQVRGILVYQIPKADKPQTLTIDYFSNKATISL